MSFAFLDLNFWPSTVCTCSIGTQDYNPRSRDISKRKTTVEKVLLDEKCEGLNWLAADNIH